MLAVPENGEQVNGMGNLVPALRKNRQLTVASDQKRGVDSTQNLFTNSEQTVDFMNLNAVIVLVKLVLVVVVPSGGFGVDKRVR